MRHIALAHSRILGLKHSSQHKQPSGEKMTIGIRLAILVATSILGLAGAGIFGAMKMQSSQAMFEGFTTHVVPAMNAMHRTSDSFKETRALLLALLMEEDADLQKAFSQKIRESNEKLQGGIKELSGIAEMQSLSGELGNIASKYSAAVDATLSSANDRDTAQLALYTKVLPAEKQLNEKLQMLESRLKTIEVETHTRIADDARRSISIYSAAMLVIVAVVAGMGFVLYRSVMRPISAMTQAMSQVASKLDFTIRVTPSSSDELSLAIEAFNGLLSSMQNSLQEISGSMSSLATETSELRLATGEMDRVSTATSSASSSVVQTVEAVAETISQLTEKTLDAERVARDSGEQASRSGETITSTIEQIRRIAETVHSAANDIESLRSQTQSISSVVGVIRDVADQTNLLALNAAIEAARAGESGRGFAVVADEVRKLAERTANSTREISELINQVQQGASAAVDTMNHAVIHVESGVESASGAITALDVIRDSSARVADTVSEIASGIRTQRDAIAHINDQFSAIAHSSGATAQASASTARSTHQLEALATQIDQTVKRYRIN